MAEDRDGTEMRRYRAYLEAELKAAGLFQVLSEAEDDASREEVFHLLIEGKLRHAATWAERLGIDQGNLEPRRGGVRQRLVKLGARLFGTDKVLPLLMRGEGKEFEPRTSDPVVRSIALEERHHAHVVRELTRPGPVGETEGRAAVLGSGGSVRAAVLGVNDGLVSNFSLVMGVAGGTSNAEFVLLAGVAGLLAGAFSMAAGEYVSMRSQRDIYEHEIRKKEVQLRDWPEGEEEELALIYRTKGLSAETSRTVARDVVSDPKIALDTLAREELGLDPGSLGSPWGASVSSFLAFVLGALIPILPYLFGAGSLAFSLSGALSAGSLVIVGSMMALISSKNVAWGGLRMVLAGGSAAAVTFGVGSLVGVTLIG